MSLPPDLRVFKHCLPIVLMFAAAGVKAQVTYETTYSSQTSDNTSACSAAQQDNSGACASAHNIPGTKGNNPIPTNTSKIALTELLKDPSRDPQLAPWFTGKIYSAAMGWWQKPGHLCCVGYSSTDPTQVQQQMQDMKSRGYAGMTMAWYGVRGADTGHQNCTLSDGFQNCEKDLSVQAFEQWLSAAATDGNFQVAVRVNKDVLKFCDKNAQGVTETNQACMTRQLQYIQSHYFASAGYMKIEIQGDGLGPRPIVSFFMDFGNCSGCDWTTIKAAVGHDVLLMKQDKNSFGEPTFEGGYSWGPAKNDNLYEDDFYSNPQNGAKWQSPQKLVWSDASKGFNDEDPNNIGWSIWDPNNHTKAATYVDQKCGQRWLDTWKHVVETYKDQYRRLDAVLVPTWNDYEEGTETETGIENCMLRLDTSLSGNTLTWSDVWDSSRTSGFTDTDMEKTVYGYEFYEANPSDDDQLHLFATKYNPNPFDPQYTMASHSLDLTSYGIPCGSKILVKAIGQPSIQNHMTVKDSAPTSCGGLAYTYIPGLELPTTDWSTLDDCGVSATCGTTQATSTVHTAPDAVQFSLAGNSPPGSQIGRWLRTVNTSTGSANDFELDLWVLLNQTAYSYSAGLIFELSHVYGGYWYHFAYKCDFSTSTWQVWNESGNTWQSTTASCSRPSQGVYTRLTFHIQHAGGNLVRYKDVQVNGGTPAALNRDFTAQSTTWSDSNKVGVKLMGNAAMNDYSVYVDDLHLGYR